MLADWCAGISGPSPRRGRGAPQPRVFSGERGRVNPLTRSSLLFYCGGVKHLTLADKSFLVGDSAAEAVMEYAVMLGQGGTADMVELNAINADGDEIRATVFLSAGVPLVTESTISALPEPDNTAAMIYLQGRLALRVSPAAFDPDPSLEEHGQGDYGDWYGLPE